MVSIDLRPWREERRRERQKQFLSLMLLIVIVTGAVCFGWFWYMQQTIDYHNDRNQYIKTETAKLDVKIKEIKSLKDELQRLKDRMEVVSNLQDDRSVLVHVFDELVRTLENGTVYDKLTLKGKTFTFTVDAEDTALSDFIRNLDASPWFDNISVSKITDKQGAGEAIKTANLTMTLKNPLATTEEGK